MKILIGIPARYASTRLPAKPLLKISRKEMLVRVWEIAQKVAQKYPSGEVICAVATEDQRILNFCEEKGIKCYLTSENCKTGTDRIAELVSKLDEKPEFIINLQGDNPTCPPWFLTSLIDAYKKDNNIAVATPVVNLTWETLEKLKESKKKNPYSGTTCIVKLDTGVGIEGITEEKEWDAVWFSKNIIPAVRKEDKLKAVSPEFSPVLRHIGLYAYRTDVLEQIGTLKDTLYSDEVTEGLEQLKFLSMGLKVKAVKVDYQGREALSGVDSPDDLKKAEDFFNTYGEY